ncbi:hypothetical protein FKM82_030813 [Ascaphus truei]
MLCEGGGALSLPARPLRRVSGAWIQQGWLGECYKRQCRGVRRRAVTQRPCKGSLPRLSTHRTELRCPRWPTAQTRSEAR